MKWFIITLTLFIVSCSPPNTIENNTESIELDTTKKIDIVELDTITKINQIENEEIVSEMIILRRNEITHSDIATQTKLISTHQKKTGLKIIDKTTGVKLDTNWGWISYSVPEQMKVKRSYSVKVRISKKTDGQNKAILILGQDDPIDDNDYPSIAVIEDIRVSGEMSAELRGSGDWFKIVPLSTQSQDIDTSTYTEWEWRIDPIRAGKSALKLVIKVKKINKDIIVFNKTIGIKSNIPVNIGSFFDKYWQWLLTTIVIPVFLFFWNKRRKRRR